MHNTQPENWPQFYTATIEGWKHLLKEDRYKYILINSFRFLTDNRRVRINAFVIMSNHVHIIWQALGDYNLQQVQTMYKKYTSQQFLKLLKEDNILKDYGVNAADRKHAFCKRNSLGTELFTHEVLLQKLNYIHQNPVEAGMCNMPEHYKYSSALFYAKGSDEFGILEDYRG